MNKKQMVSKKFIAYLVLCFMLVISLVVLVTNAYFTDSKTGGDVELDFGTVAIELGANTGVTAVDKDSQTITRNLMPGDKINVNLQVGKATGSEEFYWNARAVLTIKNGETVMKTVTTDWSSSVYNTVEDTAPVTISFSLNGEDYDNSYKNKTAVVGYEVRAIQMANLTAYQAWYAIANNADSLFTSGENLKTGLVDVYDASSTKLNPDTSDAAVNNVKMALMNELTQEDELVYIADIDASAQKLTFYVDDTNLANGDTVTFYHYDETSSEWETLGTATVQENGEGKLYVEYTFESLSPVAMVVTKSNYSEGLLFKSATYIDMGNGMAMYMPDETDNTEAEECFWIGMGTCTDTDIVVPEKDPLGRTVVGALGDMTLLGELPMPVMGDYLLANSNWIDVFMGQTTDEATPKAMSFNVTLPTSIKYIDVGAFCDTIAAFEIMIEQSAGVDLTINVNNLNELTNLEKVGFTAFLANDISEFIMPDTVTEIGYMAFAYSDVDFIELNSGLQVIGEMAFYQMQGVTQMLTGELANLTTMGDVDTLFGDSSANETISSIIMLFPEEIIDTDNQQVIEIIIAYHAGLGTGYFYSEEKPDFNENGYRFWHYDDNGKPVLWKEAIKDGVRYVIKDENTKEAYVLGDMGPCMYKENANGIVKLVDTIEINGETYNVTEIQETNMLTLVSNGAALTGLYIPKSITTMKLNNFINQGLTTVYYEGTSADWANVTNKTTTGVTMPTVLYYSATQAAGCWHYENGVPTAW